MPKTITVEKTTAGHDDRATTGKRGSSRKRNNKAARRALRAAYRTRRGMAPLYATAAQALAGSALAVPDDGWKTALAATVTGAAATAAWGRWDARIGKKRLRKRLPARSDFIAAASAVTTGGSIVTAMAATGGLQPGHSPYPALVAAWGISHGIYWWRRGKKTAAPVPALSVQLQDWQDNVACSDGPLPGSQLKDVVTTDYGWTAVIVLRNGTWRKAAQATGDIAGALDLPEEMVQIEKAIGQSARRAIIAVFNRNPLQDGTTHPGPQILDKTTGQAAVGIFYDGKPARYAFWKPSGPVHSVIYGATDGGKSRFLDMLLGTERHNGIVSWVCDPQGGQSLPRWREAVDWYEDTAQGGLAVLYAVRNVMYERSARYSLMEWTDHKGRVLRGRDHFVVDDPDPLISVTIDEAHRVLALPGAVALVLEIVLMARKCGIKLRLVFQGPKANMFGAGPESTDIREQLQSGNTVMFRTASALTDSIGLPGWEVNPSQLPMYWPDGTSTAGLGYIKGPDNRQAQFRAHFDRDPAHWATTGSTPTIEKSAAAACGKAYDERLDRLAARLRGETPLLPDDAFTGANTDPARVAPPSDPIARATAEIAAEAPAGTDDKVTAFLLERGRPVGRNTIAQETGLTVSAVKNALTRLKTKGLAVAVDRGIWAHPDHADAPAEPTDLADAA
jgi:biotin operon repressor